MNYKGILRGLSALGLIAVLSTTTALAHHSRVSTYSNTEDSAIEGVVTTFTFRNPHVLLYVDVTGEDGKVVNWMGEGSSATGWRRNGWRGNEFKPGDRVRIKGDATIDGSPMVWLDEMEVLDADTGNVAAVFSSRLDPATGRSSAVATSEASLDGTYESQVETITTPKYLPSGAINFAAKTREWEEADTNGPFYKNDPSLPYNAVGQAAFDRFDLSNDPQVFCDPPGLARQAGFSPYGFDLRQHDDHIVIEYEEYSSRREIPISSDLPQSKTRSPLGDSVAYYQGDTLVIETVGLAANPANHTGSQLSDAARITEVFTREDRKDVGTILTVTLTVTDPKYLTQPWTVSRAKVATQGYDYVVNDCVPPLRERTD